MSLPTPTLPRPCTRPAAGRLPATGKTATLYLSVQHVVDLVRKTGLSACLAGVAQRIAADYRRWPDFDKSPRLACHSAEGVVELMPIADAHRFAFKYVNGHPANHRFGLPTVMAFGVLSDVATGLPLLLSELTLTTAIRTAAMSALAASLLARPGSRSMALIGNGAQSEFQALAFRDRVGVRELRLFDTDPAASAKLAANLADQGFASIRIAASIADAVRGAEIVTTVTADKTNATILRPEMIEPGMHLNAVGGDCPGKTELHPDVLRAGTVFVEYEPQTRIEGEIQQMPVDFAVTEFWRVLTGQAAGRQSAEQVTVFDSVGFALEDYSALSYLHDRALALGLGEYLQLVPANDDPKDLFGLLRAPGPAQGAATPPQTRSKHGRTGITLQA